MEQEQFNKLMLEKKYDEIEKTLNSELRKENNLDSRFMLGICYSEQFEKKDKAIEVFENLINTTIRQPYMYHFIAKHTRNKIDSIRIVQEGIKFFPTNKLLNNQLLSYLEGEERIKQYNKLKKEQLLTSISAFQMVSYFMEKEDFQQATKILDEFKFEEGYNQQYISFVKLTCNYFMDKDLDIKEINSILVAENKSTLGYILRIIEITYLCKKNDLKYKQLLEQIDYRVICDDQFLEIINFDDYSSACFSLDTILYKLLDDLTKFIKDDKYKNKLMLIELLHKIYWEETIVSKSEQRNAVKLINIETKNSDNNLLHYYLLEIYQNLNENKKQFDKYIEIIENYFVKDEDYITFENFTDDELKYVVGRLCNITFSKYSANRYQKLYENIFDQLFGRKLYEDIIKIADSINYEYLEYLNFGFELAFSFKKLNRDDEAKKIYEGYVKINSKNDASINNLGVIYEKEDQFKKALKMYEKAEKITHNTIYANNIKRCNQLIEDQEKQLNSSKEGLTKIEDESFWIINELKMFYLNADERNNVICSQKKLPTLLCCSPTKAYEVLNKFLDNNYIFKLNDHDYETDASVYKINILIKDKLKEIEKENELLSSMLINLENFTINNLKNLNYQTVIIKLNKIKTVKIRKIFIRDYQELVYNYLSKQSKSVVLLSGTIMELLLLYILNANSIAKYKVGSKNTNKKIEEMDITEMLEVCTNEKLLHNTPQKFIDAMKNFRNFIHPGKELREKLLEIDNHTVELSMSIVTWLILTLNI